MEPEQLAEKIYELLLSGKFNLKGYDGIVKISTARLRRLLHDDVNRIVKALELLETTKKIKILRRYFGSYSTTYIISLNHHHINSKPFVVRKVLKLWRGKNGSFTVYVNIPIQYWRMMGQPSMVRVYYDDGKIIVEPITA